MKTLALMVVVLALVTQARNQSPRELLDAARPLTSAEIATILAASQNALTAKTFRLSFVGRGGGPDVLMGRAGQPKVIRWVFEGGIVGGVVFADGTSSRAVETHRRHTELTHYTGRPARHCDGSTEQGELVVQYKQDGSANGWTATAGRRDAPDFGGAGIAPVFEMLQGGGPITSGERRRIGGRWARAFISPWTPPVLSFAEPPLLTGDPIPNVLGKPLPNNAVQSLWIDTESLLPLRWEASNRGSLAYGYDFRYRPMDLRPPSGIHAPECID
jgi:hypothetical protein